MNAIDAVVGRPGLIRRWWRREVIGQVDHDAVLRQIAEESGWSSRYAFLIVISVGISILGLLMPSVAVLIGAMLVSPLMMPIIGLGFSLAMLDFPEIRRTLYALAMGAAIAVALSVVMVWMSPVQTITSEIAARTRPTLFDLLVALLSALAGGYALIRGRGGTVVGVAIAIALMPPLAVVGFGIATQNATVAGGALLLFFTNLITIALTAAVVARVYGFGAHLSPSHARWQTIGLAVVLAALAVPLAGALRQIAFEAVAQRQIRDAILGQFPDDARLAQIDIDHDARPLRVRAVVVTPVVSAGADTRLRQSVAARLRRDIDIHVDQVQTSGIAGQTEAAQIARAASSRDAGQRGLSEQIALIIGAARETVQVDSTTHVIAAEAGELPGLGAAGYRAIEERARAAAPGWDVRIAPPAMFTDLPALRIDDGVIDDQSIGQAAWLSQRRGRALAVLGGTLRQREAIAAAIVARGGTAAVADAGGALRLEWIAVVPVSPPPAA